MQTAAKQPITEQEYLALERHAEIGSEFLDGETWLLHTLEGAKGTLQLESINCRVPLPELYENTVVALAAKPRKPQPHPPTKGPRKP